MSKNKKNSNRIFMIIVLVVIVVLMGALGFINNFQTKQAQEGLPSYEEYTGELEVKGLNLDRQPTLGKVDAPIEIVEFGDFKCPACANWEQSVFPQLVSEYIDTGVAKFSFINFQFLAKDSILAGIAGEAIYNQNKDAFWTFYKSIYEKQGIESNTWATQSYLNKFVKENVPGIDYAKFEQDLKNHTYLKEVKEDYQIAENSKITGTPAILVNGKKVENPTFNNIKAAIEGELKTQENENTNE